MILPSFYLLSRPLIAVTMIARSGKQCRERYINHLDPDMKRSPWTTKEDRALKDLYPELGSKWSQYMYALPGRSDNAIKNRYHVVCRMNADCDSVSDESTVVPSSKKRSMEHISSGDEESVSEDHDSRIKRLKMERQLLDDQIREMEEAESLLTSADTCSESMLSELSATSDFSDLDDGLAFEFDFNDELW